MEKNKIIYIKNQKIEFNNDELKKHFDILKNNFEDSLIEISKLKNEIEETIKSKNYNVIKINIEIEKIFRVLNDINLSIETLGESKILLDSQLTEFENLKNQLFMIKQGLPKE